MKKIIAVLFVFISVSIHAHSQSSNNSKTTDKNVSVENAEEETEPLFEKKLKARDRFMMNITFDNLFHKETNGFETKWHSRGFAIYYLYDIPLNTKFVSFAAGLGFRHASYYHNSNMIEDTATTRFFPINNFDESPIYKQRKMALSYFEVPLELRFYSKPSKKSGRVFKTAIGFRGGVRMTAARVEKNKTNDYFKKEKTKNFKDFALLEGGPTLRIGYGGFNLFAYYSVTKLFKKNKGPEMTPFSIGVSFTGL